MRPQAVVLLLAFCSLAAADPPAENAAGKEMTLFQGEWQLVSLELKDRKADDLKDSGPKVLFKGNKIVVNDQELFSFTIEPGTQPRLIDLVRLTDPDKGAVLEGIYALEADTLKICLATAGGVRERPTEFTTKQGSNVVVILQRIRP